MKLRPRFSSRSIRRLEFALSALVILLPLCAEGQFTFDHITYALPEGWGEVPGDKWITRKSMPAHKLGRLWKFLASEVDQWVKGGHAAEDVATGTTGAAIKLKPPEH